MKRRILSWTLVGGLAAALVVWGGGLALAQEATLGAVVRIDAIDSEFFPQVAAYVTVLDGDGFPVVGLTAADFEVTEDGQAVSSDQLSVATGTNVGNRVALVVDTSMDEEDMVAMRAAVAAFVSALGTNDEVALVTFSDAATVVQDLTADKDRVASTVAELTVSGSRTDLYTAVEVAAGLLANADTDRRTLVVVSNTGDNANLLPVEQAVTAATEAGVAVYAVTFATVPNATPLQALADSTGGQVRLLAAPEQLRTELQTIALLLRQGYLMTFESGLAADGSTHTLGVSAAVAGETVAVENSFSIAPSRITVAAPTLSGETLRGVVTLSAQANGPAPITEVTYLVNGEPLATLYAPPFGFEWDTTALTPGQYTLTVAAKDADGSSAALAVPVTVATLDPLQVTVVLSNAAAMVGEAIEAQVVVTGTEAVSQVEFKVNGTVVGIDRDAPYSLMIDSNAYGVGAVTVSATVRGINGGSGEGSAPLTLEDGSWVPVFLRNRWTVWVTLFFAMFGVILMAYLVLFLVRASQRRSVRRRFAMQLANAGNVEHRYGLQIDEPSGTLKFRLEGQGGRLPVEVIERTEYDETVRPVMSGVQPAGNASAAGAARPAGGSSGPVAGKPGGGGAQQAKKQAQGFSSYVANAMMSVAAILPPSVGKGLQNTAMQIRGAQTAVRDIESKPGELKAVMSDLTPPGQRGKQPTPTPQAGNIGQGAAAATPSSSAQPMMSGSSAQMREVRARTARVVREEWAKTPIVSAGEEITIQLVVDPRRVNLDRVVEFEVRSQVLGLENDAPRVQPVSIELKPLPWIRRLLPALIMAATLLTLFILVRLAFLFSAAFGSL